MSVPPWPQLILAATGRASPAGNDPRVDPAIATTTTIPTTLLLGASGAVGAAVRRRWREESGLLLPSSRRGIDGGPAIDLEVAPGALPAIDGLLCAGPLDALSRWLPRLDPPPSRVVALSSTSVHTKAASPDAAERRLAATLREAEDRLVGWAGARGATLTLLRPTLVWGGHDDRSLGRIVALARRARCFPLPAGRLGLRQPVHADDLAAAMIRALGREPGPAWRLDLPGGETLGYDEMVRRVLAARVPGAKLLRLPATMFRALHAVGRMLGLLDDAGAGVVARLREDLVFDDAEARARLDWRPRAFLVVDRARDQG